MGTISSVYSVPTVNKDSQNETESTSQDHPEKVMDSGENSQHSEEGHSNQTDKQSHTVSVAIEEIFGETNEQKIIRLEKLLGKERQEKWEMIEKSERTRVDLVNKAKELQQLKNELENSKRQAKELELALKRLKREESSQAQGEEDKEDEEDDQDSEKSTKLKKELERFRADLSEKREARRKALNSISTEMNRLREELENEKQVRRKLERDIRLQEKTDMMSDQESASDLSIICAKKENETLKKEVDILTDDIDKLKELRTENKSLKLEIKQLSHEVTSLNTLIFQLKNDYKEEKRKLEKTNKEKVEIEKEKDRNVKMRKDLENEKEKMWEEYDKEKEEINKRTSALKEVIEISRQMLAIRESQVQELKTKLKEIEESVAHSKILEEEGLRVEYEKQLENIKTLKELYEERVRLMEMEREKLKETITQHLKTIQDQKGEIDDLKEQCGNTSEELEKEKLENQSLEKSLKMSIAKSKDFENELTLMNNMFTQMLLGPFNSGSDTDLDKLTEFLQENHQLITELTTKEESSEIASAFPKLLLDLLTQAEGSENADPNWKSSSMLESTDTISEQSESVLEEHQGAVLPVLSYKNATVFRDPTAGQNEQQPVKPSESIDPAVQEIASNLPKVWKVLTELLSIHSAAEGPTPGDEKQCYKNIETPYGTKSVISVSNTFIRLKDLILEKKSLQKELGRLKQLNSHLEIRLDDQEKRLSQVQCELHKTWGIVGKMRAQHQQLHNHEKILRYELQEKRIMLSELKQELEYCRDKWERARQKNAESETEWKKLRKEFAARKIKNDVNSNLNDSAESGFSDEPNDSGEEAESFDADRSSTQSPVDKNLLSEGGTSKGAVPKARDGVKPSDKSKSRAIRLKRLEDQCQLLVRQVDITAHKSNYLSDRLEQLHEHHASSEEIHRPIVLKKESESADLPQSNQTEGASASAQLSETPTTLETLPPDIKQERPKGSRTEKSQGSEVLRIDRSIENPTKEADIESDARMAGNEKKAQVTSDINSETTQEHLLRLEPEALSRQVEKMDGEGANLAGSSPDQKTIRNESSESREERLRRLENEGRSLLSNVISTVEKSENLSNKLDEMHARVLRRELLRENSDEKTDSEKPINDENKPEDNVEESASALALTEETSSKGAIPRTEAKEQRLKRLEEECQNFMKKATDTVQKSIQLSNKLDDIHDTYVNYEVSKMTFPQENKDESNNSQEKSGDDSEKTHG